MANSTTNDFIRFSAYSIKDLITRKLSEDSNFTDQVYEGSNLAILIDIVSYMYQCLIYNINNAASESMFSDTQLYENITRLCKFIGYHPQGYKPAQMVAYIDNSSLDADQRYIYPCTAFDTGLYDSEGNKIYFSTAFNFGKSRSSSIYTNLTLMNGKWKHYSTVFTANGTDYETFTLDGLMSDSSKGKYVANNKIQVFVINENGCSIWMNDPNEIFIKAYDSSSATRTFSKLYNENDPVYTAYLNENKTYEIKFGNGIIGRRLKKGDKVHVMYLESNGPDGYIDLSLIDLTQTTYLQHSPQFFGLSQEQYDQVFKNNGSSLVDYNIAGTSDQPKNCKITLDPNSLTYVQPEENVESIRNNAPEWFKTGNRLITKKDYEYFITSNSNDIFAGVIDAKCMNNWDYLTTFYRWLYNMALNPIEPAQTEDPDPYRYLSRARLINAGYEYVDAADANNIYLWLATTNESDILTLKQSLNNEITQIKTMTSETYPLAPVDVYFDISFTPLELYYENLKQADADNENAFDANWSYLEITIADNSIYSTTQVNNYIVQAIEDEFNPVKCKIGQTINYDNILDKIYAINGVERVRTVYYPDDYLDPEAVDRYSQYKTRACDGLAFASWSHTDLISRGDDLQINNTNRSLEPFQFPRLVPGFDLNKKIKIIKKSMNTTSPIKF